MTLSLLVSLSPAIQIHIFSALLAAVLGPVALFRTRRDRVHRVLGYVWVGAMAVAALSSFFIHTIRVIGPFSPIHLLSVYVLYGLVQAVAAARAGRIAQHRGIMRGMYVGAIGVAGTFSFLPGRALHQMVFGQDNWAGFAAIALVVGVAGTLTLRRSAAPV